MLLINLLIFLISNKGKGIVMFLFEFFNGLWISYKINFGKGDILCELMDEILIN